MHTDAKEGLRVYVAVAAAALLSCMMAMRAFALDTSATASASAPSITRATTPSALLSVDRHRATIVDRIVDEWGQSIAQAGLTKEQLRAMLASLRSDYLLAASLSGSFDGLRQVLVDAALLDDKAAVAPDPKALGDAVDDLVYTPVTPCREVDTRNTGGAIATNSSRDFRVWVASGGFSAQGGSSTNCGIPANPVAVVVNLTAVSPSGGGNFIAYATGTPTFTSVLNYSAAVSALANGVIVPVCHTNCANQLTIATNGASADVVIDIVGYFRPPSGGAVVVGSGIFNSLPKWAADGSSLVSSAVFEASGQVGIGTTSPANRLQIGVIPSFFTGNDLAIGNGSKAMSFFQSSQASTWFSGTSFALIGAAGGNGFVGIGTQTPGNKLEVGSAFSAGFSGNDIAFGNGAQGSGLAQTANVAQWYSSTDITLMPRSNGSGRVGINTPAPNYPLEVQSSAPYTNVFGFVAQNGQESVFLSKCTVLPCPGQVSIYASNEIMATQLDLISDARVKDVVGVSDSAADLDALNAIEVVDYTMRDRAVYGDRQFKKVVAQQIEGAAPQVVSRHEGFLPNVYQVAERAIPTDRGVVLHFDKGHHLSARAKRVKVFRRGERSARVLAIMSVISDQDVLVDAPIRSADRVFVYGEEVDDLRTVDYEGLAALNVSATQELGRRIAKLRRDVEAVAAQRDMALAIVERVETALRDSSAALEAARLTIVAQSSALDALKATLERDHANASWRPREQHDLQAAQ